MLLGLLLRVFVAVVVCVLIDVGEHGYVDSVVCDCVFFWFAVV